jgi:hypothetical protein
MRNQERRQAVQARTDALKARLTSLGIPWSYGGRETLSFSLETLEQAASRLEEAELLQPGTGADSPASRLTVLPLPFDLMRVACGDEMTFSTTDGHGVILRLPTVAEYRHELQRSAAHLLDRGIPADQLPPLPSDARIAEMIRPLPSRTGQ